MDDEYAECGELSHWLAMMGPELDRFLRFEHPDPMTHAARWQNALGRKLPETGLGLAGVMRELSKHVIPNGSPIPRPGFTSFITTGGSSAGTVAALAASVAAPQRIGLTAFQYLEALSSQWLAQLFELPPQMQGLYSSGGSVANLVALGAARQAAFEQRGRDPARDGLNGTRTHIYTSTASHRTIHRAAAVLGLGRDSVIAIPTDDRGRLRVDILAQRLRADRDAGAIPVAVVANAGTTATGAIDPLRAMSEVAGEFNCWFHVDGAYGLPGILDPAVRPLYDGLEGADSVIVDPHKWLGAPVGIGATFVRDHALLRRAFTQEASDYLEGSCSDEPARHSLDDLGVPYSDFGVELSAPSRGAVVWALLREIGKQGMTARVQRHNAMARTVAERARAHPNLELLLAPTLSICCFRYRAANCRDLNQLNRDIHRRLIHNGHSLPSTAVINGQLAIRPCFIGARTGWRQADELVDEVLTIGNQLSQQQWSPFNDQNRG